MASFTIKAEHAEAIIAGKKLYEIRSRDVLVKKAGKHGKLIKKGDELTFISGSILVLKCKVESFVDNTKIGEVLKNINYKKLIPTATSAEDLLEKYREIGIQYNTEICVIELKPTAYKRKAEDWKTWEQTT